MSTLLRRGDIKDYMPLGQDGQAVYTVASQLRDAIRFKRGKMFAEYLAIPQRNDTGNVIDWYVPFDSQYPDGRYHIIPWTAATDEEREKALAELDVFKANMLDLGKELGGSQSLKGDQLLFSRLLYTANSKDEEQLKAIRFPNEEHIYLVNDRPVITFWGFLEKNQTPYADPFLCLRPKAPSIQQPPVEPAVAAPVAAAVLEKGHKCRWWMWLLPLLLLLAGLAYFFLKPYFFPEMNVTSSTSELITQSSEKENVATAEKTTCTDPVTYYRIGGFLRDAQGKLKLLPRSCDIIIEDENKYPYKLVDNQWVNAADGVPVTDPNILNNLSATPDERAVANSGVLPNEQAVPTPAENNGLGNNATEEGKTLSTPETNNGGKQDPQQNGLAPVDPLNQTQNQPVPDPLSTNTTQPTGKNLTLDPTALSNGKMDFLNGNWNAGAGIQDKATGKPLKLNYNFNNGQGTVKLQRGDGVTCQGNVQANANGGGLNINNTGVATCSDGSTYQLPAVICKPTQTGEADCNGAYGSGKAFPMSMKSN